MRERVSTQASIWTFVIRVRWDVSNLIRVDRIHSRSPDQAMKGAEFRLLNARSISNKSRVIRNFIADYDLDVLTLTEPWLRGNDYDDYPVQDICLADYIFHHTPRHDANGDGVGINTEKSFQGGQRNPKYLSYF